jgi:hypothetical protein
MTRAPLVTVLLVGLAVVLGCGKSSEKEDEAAQQAQTGKLMPTQRPYETPEHLKRFGKGYPQLPEEIMDTLRAQKKRHNITRDEQWTGQGGVLGNDFFEVWYPEGPTMITHAMRVVDDMMRARSRFDGVFGSAPMERLVIVLPPYLDQYREWTGRDYWHYSDLRADTMTIQPVYILLKRGLLDVAMPHEYFQWALGHYTNYGAPRWVEEGVASYFSNEEYILEQNVLEFPVSTRDMPIERIEEVLVLEESREDTRVAYYLAHRMVASLVERYGEEKLVEALSLMAQGHDMDAACQRVYGLSYTEVSDLVLADAKQT